MDKRQEPIQADGSAQVVILPGDLVVIKANAFTVTWVPVDENAEVRLVHNMKKHVFIVIDVSSRRALYQNRSKTHEYDTVVWCNANGLGWLKSDILERAS